MNHDQKETDRNVSFVLIPNNGLNIEYFLNIFLIK